MIGYRKARPGDALAISAIHVRNFCANNEQGLTDALSKEFLALWTGRLQVDNANQLIQVAQENEVLLGFICVYIREDMRWGSLIDNLHVASGERQKGIASSLMRQAIDWLMTHAEDDAVYLTVLESNTVARSMYERLGGECVETFESDNHAGTRLPNCRYTWTSPRKMVVR